MKDFYIDFSEYPEEVAKVLYEEVQKHAFELGYEWKDTTKTIEKYDVKLFILTFTDNEMSMWIGGIPTLYERVSVEEFLKMEKVPKYHVGMPMGKGDGDLISVYIGEGDNYDVFKAIPIKHSSKRLEYTLCNKHMYDFWKPIDPSRIKVTIK